MADPPSNPRPAASADPSEGGAGPNRGTRVDTRVGPARAHRTRAEFSSIELRVGAALAATRFGPVEHFTEIDSTNQYLLERALEGAAAGVVAVADHQHAGRGRLGRHWTAPPGASLLVSVLLRPAIDLARWHLITVTAGIAATEAIATCTDGAVDARLKWPNDLVVRGRKIAGLLAETEAGALVVGMGLNVDWPEVPPELDGIATALNREQGAAARVPTRAEMLTVWLRRWNGWLAIAEAPAGAARVRAAVERTSATLGNDVRVELAHESFTGVAKAITDAGHLVVETPTGRREINSGDVVHLRPSGS
jgi:BirA family biotin operon repressor/biotin-[acetyl-CoA-carboxylase] ligase